MSEDWLRRGQALQQQGRFTEAEALCREVLSQSPNEHRAYYQLANLARQRGDLKEALSSCRRAIANCATEAAYFYLQALLLEDTNQVSQAIASLQEAIRLRPRYAEAHNNLGLLYADQKQLERAIACFRSAIEAKPDYARAYNNLGSSLREVGQLQHSLAALRRAIELQPDYPYAYHNLGVAFKDLGQLPQAEKALRKALQMQPKRHEIYHALGSVLRQQGKLDEAIATYHTAVQLSAQGRAGDYVALAFTLAERGERDAARLAYREALTREPSHIKAALGFHLTLPPIYEDQAGLEAIRAEYAQGLAALSASVERLAAANAPDSVLESLQWSNFYLAYQGKNDKPLQVGYANFVASMLDRANVRWREELPRPTVAGRRIRIGFACGFFTESTVGMYFKSWITRLDRASFEIFVYHLRPGMNVIASELFGCADQARHPTGADLSLARLAELIYRDALDVLVYPELGMDSTAFLLAALRLAPVQCAGWGHPVTSGHPTIDYFFSSAVMEPSDAEAHYSERLVCLPGIGTAYSPPELPPAQTRESWSLPADKLLLLCPQSLFKIHPDNDRLFAAILDAEPQATLVLFSGRHPSITERFTRRLQRAFDAHGLNVKERTKILPSMSRSDYLAVNQLCDVMLDTLHWSGGNTSLDALASGLPVVTLPGELMRSRQTAGMLSLLAIDCLCAQNAEQYQTLAIELLQQPKRRRALRAEIVGNHHRLFRDETPISALTRFYQSLFQ